MSWAKIKHALNSTLGTEGFIPLDAYISSAVSSILNGGSVEYDTPGNYTYTVPDGIRIIYVTACAGGGGGGGGSTKGGYEYAGGGGGGGEAVVRYLMHVKNKETISITVGKGGEGGRTGISVDANGDGEDGTNTQIKNLILKGGKGGKSKFSSEPNNIQIQCLGGSKGGVGGGNGGIGGTNYNNKKPTKGENGIIGMGGVLHNNYIYGGSGGGSLGNGGENLENDRVMNGQKGGGGAGGRYYNSTSPGGKGGDGYVKIEYGVDLSPIKNIQRGIIQFNNSQNLSVKVSLSGFNNDEKMIALLNGSLITSKYSSSNEAPFMTMPYVSNLSTTTLTVARSKLSPYMNDYDELDISYQVIEFP